MRVPVFSYNFLLLFGFPGILFLILRISAGDSFSRFLIWG